MSEPAEFDPERLLALSEQREGDRRAHEQLVADYAGRLLQSDDLVVVDALSSDEAVLTAAQQQSELRVLAMLALMYQTVAAHVPAAEVSPIKQRMQAHLQLHDYSQAWLELVDEVLPGEPLDPNDFDTLAAELVTEDEVLQRQQQQLTDSRQAIATFLGDEAATIAPITLEFIVQQHVLMSSHPGLKAEFADRLKVFLLDNNQAAPRVMQLVDRLFG